MSSTGARIFPDRESAAPTPLLVGALTLPSNFPPPTQVMGIDKDFAAAFAKAQIAAGQKLPKTGKVFVSMADKYKPDIIEIARNLGNLGFGLVATSECGGCRWWLWCRTASCERVGTWAHQQLVRRPGRVSDTPALTSVLASPLAPLRLPLAAGTALALRNAGVPCEQVFKIQEGRPNPADLMRNGEVTLMMMTSGGDEADLRDGKELRRLALQVGGWGGGGYTH